METKIGTTVISESVGSAQDVAMDLPGSKSNPEVYDKARKPRRFENGDYSKVYVKLGMTRALGEFEFARIDVAIEEFCEPTPEARKDTFQEITQEVKQHMSKVYKKILAARKLPHGK